ncbi:MAG: hypothetical protein GWN00_29355, partial [Aliifodinibius sp.]|nr:hypothetical protein [Fodinibius sp.]NIY28755.1 hypothetical protein [Fodinibius sp.]
SAEGFFTIDLKGQTDVKQLVQRLKTIAIVNPVYFHEGLEAIPYDHFIVQFDSTVSPAAIDALNKQHHVAVVKVSTVAQNLYTLQVTSDSDLLVLEMSNLYY